MILEFLESNHSSSLATILGFLGEYLIPLAKVELKVTIDKGFNGQSCFDSPDMGDVESYNLLSCPNLDCRCFDSPDMGDVERLKFEKFKEKVERSRGLKMISENY